MPDWDEDSPQLRENFVEVLRHFLLAARRREKPTVEVARRWHQIITKGLNVPDARQVGSFRGEAGLEHLQVRVGADYGVDSRRVGEELAQFETRVRAFVSHLDSLLPVRRDPDEDQLAAILDLCAWVHSEWIRIHPFTNGNGRIARIWANSIAVRYSLPPFVTLRPRPEFGYVAASVQAMRGDWRPTAVVFRRLLDAFLSQGFRSSR